MPVGVRPKQRKRAIAAALTGLGLFGAGLLGAVCVTAAPARQESLYWPAPPPDARLAYVAQFHSERDFPRSKRTLWQKLKRLLVGYQEEWALRAPYALDVCKGQLYIADPEAQTVWLADLTGQTFSPFVRSDKKVPLPSPIGVAVEEDGRVFVADSRRNLVLVFSPAGKLLSTLGSGRFGRPTGLAVDRRSHVLYVADTLRHEIAVYSTRDLKEKRSFGGPGNEPGRFNLPVHLAVRKGILYVVDTMNFRVQVFDAEGRFLGLFGQMGDGAGDFARPKGIAVDSEGNVYVADALFDNVQVFDRLGRLLLGFGKVGRQAGQFWLPAGLAVDEADRLYVADSANRRVQVFQYLKNGR